MIISVHIVRKILLDHKEFVSGKSFVPFYNSFGQ